MFSFALGLAMLVGQEQPPCTQINALKAKVYTFRPSQLTAETRSAKSKEMDGFWDLVRSQKDGAACLRQLLVAEQEDSFFLYDGASLLADLDRSAAAMPVILNSIRRAPIAEIDAGAYVDFAIRLARAGADISALAERFLAHPAEAAIAQAHSLKIDRLAGAMLLFGALPAERADAALGRALEAGDAHVRESAAQLLVVLMNEDGLKILSQSPRVGELPAATRAQIDQMRTASYPAPSSPAAFTRAQVLEHLRLLPRTEAEFRAAQIREEHFRAKLPESASIEALFRQMSDGPPFTSLAGHGRFIESAIATLTADDLPAVREWRRQSVRSLSDETLGDFMAFTVIVHGVVGRLNLYAEFRKPR